MRRLIAAILITATAGFVLTTSQPASASDPGSEAAFVNHINGFRASRGVGGLQTHSVLTAKAQAWAEHMAATNCLCHSNLPDGITVGWRKLGENVGHGPSVDSLHTAFVNSPPHAANMLDSQFHWVGVGVAYSSSGEMWVAEEFMDGDPPPAAMWNPIGTFESATRLPGAIAVQGWAIDPDTAGPVAIHVYVDGLWDGQTTANTYRPDVGGAYPNYGSAHGYFGYVPVGVGLHLVCVYAINQGLGTANTQLGCSYVHNTPKGNLEVATPTPSGTAVGGWALGPDTTGPIGVHFYFNGQWAGAVTAAMNRPDVGAAYGGMGSDHGFTAVVPNQTGVLCAYAIAAAGGDNPLIGCRFVNTNPIGTLDSASRQSGGVMLRGWAVDRDASGPVEIHIYVDGWMVAAIPANVARPDIAAAFPSMSSNHAFASVIPIGGGTHLICAYGINRATGTTNPQIGCRYIT
ncbi:MAG: CAP domain-containing protein [Acidimicrobiia bacterium]